MKKYLLTLTILMVILSESKAQYYPILAPDTTEWCLTYNYYPVRSGEMRAFYYQQMTAHHDTIIDSVLYKKVFGVNGLETYFGAMREDTSSQKVYFIYAGDSTQQLLYDFTLNLNDTFNIDLHNNTYGNMLDGDYIVDSVSWINIRGGLRKYIRLHNPSNVNAGMSTGQPLKFEWVESVGEIHDPVYIYISDYNWGGEISYYCPTDFETIVLKQTHDTIKNYMSECALDFASLGWPAVTVSSDTCQLSYGGSIDELSMGNGLLIYPNPSNGRELSIDVKNYILKENVNISISDEVGRIVYTAVKMPAGNSVRLNELSLSNGIYFISLSDTKNIFAKSKLIVAGK